MAVSNYGRFECLTNKKSVRNVQLNEGHRKKVLLVTADPLNRGGVQIFLSNWIQYAQKEFDFVWYFIGGVEDEEFAKKIISQNVILQSGNRYEAQNKIFRHCLYFINIFRLLRSNYFDIIHVNTGSLIIHVDAMLAAKINKINIRIAHSHNCLIKEENESIFNEVLRKIIWHNATRYAACSNDAAKWLFGAKNIDKVIQINNCIDSKKFAFSEEKRRIYRHNLGLANSMVIGHVGRMNPQKNHLFLIEIFKCILQKINNARLLLVGTGELAKEIREFVINNDLSDRVIFVGVTEDVQNYMCAMDVFVLPSLYEGLPIVGIEAQANGLPCFFSDAITREVNITGNERFISLSESPDSWANEIISLNDKHDEKKRKNALHVIKETNYDISNMAKDIQKLYQ